MLKNFSYYGTYHDENLTIGLLLENPIDYGQDAAVITFSVTLKAASNKGVPPRLEDFTFYLMDEGNRIFNTIFVTALASATVIDDVEPVCKPDGLILAEFKPEYLFQDLRIAFYDRSHEKINIIELRH